MSDNNTSPSINSSNTENPSSNTPSQTVPASANNSSAAPSSPSSTSSATTTTTSSDPAATNTSSSRPVRTGSVTPYKASEGSKLFIGNLDYGATDQELKTVFEAQSKQVMFVDVLSGYGFVKIKTKEEAERLKALMDKTQVRGRPINIELANDSKKVKTVRSPATAKPVDEKSSSKSDSEEWVTVERKRQKKSKEKLQQPNHKLGGSGSLHKDNRRDNRDNRDNRGTLNRGYHEFPAQKKTRKEKKFWKEKGTQQGKDQNDSGEKKVVDPQNKQASAEKVAKPKNDAQVNGANGTGKSRNKKSKKVLAQKYWPKPPQWPPRSPAETAAETTTTTTAPAENTQKEAPKSTSAVEGASPTSQGPPAKKARNRKGKAAENATPSKDATAPAKEATTPAAKTTAAKESTTPAAKTAAAPSADAQKDSQPTQSTQEPPKQASKRTAKRNAHKEPQQVKSAEATKEAEKKTVDAPKAATHTDSPKTAEKPAEKPADKLATAADVVKKGAQKSAETTSTQAASHAEPKGKGRQNQQKGKDAGKSNGASQSPKSGNTTQDTQSPPAANNTQGTQKAAEDNKAKAKDSPKSGAATGNPKGNNNNNKKDQGRVPPTMYWPKTPVWPAVRSTAAVTVTTTAPVTQSPAVQPTPQQTPAASAPADNKTAAPVVQNTGSPQPKQGTNQRGKGRNSANNTTTNTKNTNNKNTKAKKSSAPAKPASIYSLKDESMIRIFSNLRSPHFLANCASVCKSWNKLSSHPSVWKSFASTLEGHAKAATDPKINWKKWVEQNYKNGVVLSKESEAVKHNRSLPVQVRYVPHHARKDFFTLRPVATLQFSNLDDFHAETVGSGVKATAHPHWPEHFPSYLKSTVDFLIEDTCINCLTKGQHNVIYFLFKQTKQEVKFVSETHCRSCKRFSSYSLTHSS